MKNELSIKITWVSLWT